MEDKTFSFENYVIYLQSLLDTLEINTDEYNRVKSIGEDLTTILNKAGVGHGFKIEF
jgi:hypothetical protein